MAILTNPRTVAATVSFIGNGRPSKYEAGQDYYKVCFESQELAERTVWKSLLLEEVCLLHKGMEVTLRETERNNRKTWDIILPENTYGKGQPAPAPAETLPPAVKREIASYSKEMINLYSYLWKESKAALEAQGCEDVETIRTCTSSVFISAQRKFNLT